MPPWLQNIIVLASFITAIVLLRLGARNERWRRAWKALKQDRIGFVAGAVIGCYMLIGGLDLIKIYPTYSMLDWLLKDVVILRDEPTKASYSAPFARSTFALADPAPLAHPGRHFFGTTQIGKDTLV